MDRNRSLAGRPPPAQPHSLSAHELAVLAAIRDTPYGAVEVVLHQSRIVQIVRTEKVKIEDGNTPG
jgi:hypothetical protein